MGLWRGVARSPDSVPCIYHLKSTYMKSLKLDVEIHGASSESTVFNNRHTEPSRLFSTNKALKLKPSSSGTQPFPGVAVVLH